MAASMTVIYLLDSETNIEYEVRVSKEDAEKERQDIMFATQLLAHVKGCPQQTVNDILPQRCSQQTINDKQASNNISIIENSVDCTDGTHLWTHNETLFLLQLYNDYKDKFHNGKHTTKYYWKEIAKLMQEHGYDVTGIKCSTKFQALKRTYKSIIDHNKKSGNNRKEWEYLKIMQELFEDKPWVKPLAIAGSHVDETEELNKENDTKLILKEKGSKKRKLTLIEEYIQQTKEERQKRREMREKEHEEKMLALRKIENIMEKLLEKENS